MAISTLTQNDGNLTEAEAIQQAKQGVAAAFEYLYRAHCRRVYSLCLWMTKNPADAEDLTQQAFAQGFRKIGIFRGQSAFATWLHRVTVNVVLMHLRRRKPAELLAAGPEGHSSNSESSHEDGTSDTSMLGAIERLNLMRAIRKLPSGYKQVFLLHDVIGYEHSEIGQLVGCSTGCSKSQLHKARRRLQRLHIFRSGSLIGAVNSTAQTIAFRQANLASNLPSLAYSITLRVVNPWVKAFLLNRNFSSSTIRDRHVSSS